MAFGRYLEVEPHKVIARTGCYVRTRAKTIILDAAGSYIAVESAISVDAGAMRLFEVRRGR